MPDGVIIKNVVISECIHYTAGVKFQTTLESLKWHSFFEVNKKKAIEFNKNFC